MKLTTFALTVSALAVASLSGCQTAASNVRKEPARDPVAAAANPHPAPEPVKPAPAPVVAPQKNADSRLEEGVTAFKAGKYADARIAFQRVVRDRPDDATARLNLALAEERLGMGQARLDDAINRNEAALKAPDKAYDPVLLNNLAVAYRMKKRYPDAEAAARKVLSRTKDNADAYKNLALVYYEEGNYRLAEIVNANARKLDDQDPGLLNNLGMIYLKTGEQPRALVEFKRALELDPAFVPAYVNLGSMALAYRDYSGAERAFAKVVELAPARADGHLLRAFALDGLKTREPKKGLEAGAEFEKVLALEPTSTEALCGAGWAYSADKGGWDRAAQYLGKCKALASTSPQDRQNIDAKLASLDAQKKAALRAGANPADTSSQKAAPASKLSDSAGK